MMLKLGRNRPASRPKLRLGHYLKADLPAPPATVHWTTAADSADALFNILANDRLGDCTAAGAGHIQDAFFGNCKTGHPWVSESDTVSFYSASTGYDPRDPSTDRGGDEITVLDTWKSKGFFADGTGKIAGYVGVDANNAEQVKQAIWLFGNVYFGVELPDDWLHPAPSGNGFAWDVAGDSDPSNGHCFVGLAYNSQGVIIDTWGMIGTLTWAAVAKYASHPSGELYTVLSEDWITKTTGLAPNGLAFDALQADLAAL